MPSTHCWLCGSRATEEWKPRSLPARLTPDDLKITDAHYGRTLRLLRCSACSFIFADGQELSELNALYAQLVDEGYLESAEARRLQMRWMIQRLERRAPLRSLLDVGCASGILLEEAEKLGMRATGIEPSASLAAEAGARKLRVIHGVLPCRELANETFDLVALVDVIEHVSDPVALLTAAAQRMSAQGAMLVVTPDIGSLTAKLLGRRWWHLRVAHVCYFDAQTFQRAAQAAQLSVESAFRPLWFFPAAYLLERLKRYVPLPLPDLSHARVGKLVVPLQLFDSWAFVLRKAS